MSLEPTKRSKFSDFPEIVIGQLGGDITQDRWDSIFANKDDPKKKKNKANKKSKKNTK